MHLATLMVLGLAVLPGILTAPIPATAPALGSATSPATPPAKGTLPAASTTSATPATTPLAKGSPTKGGVAVDSGATGKQQLRTADTGKSVTAASASKNGPINPDKLYSPNAASSSGISSLSLFSGVMATSFAVYLF